MEEKLSFTLGSKSLIPVVQTCLGLHPIQSSDKDPFDIQRLLWPQRVVLWVLKLEPKLGKFICQELSLIRTQIHTASLHQMCHPAECRDLVKLVFSVQACCRCFNTCHFWHLEKQPKRESRKKKGKNYITAAFWNASPTIKAKEKIIVWVWTTFICMRISCDVHPVTCSHPSFDPSGHWWGCSEGVLIIILPFACRGGGQIFLIAAVLIHDTGPLSF